MDLLKRCGGAFVAGGLAGIIGQLMIYVAGLFTPADYAVLVAMLLYGVIGVVMICTGFYFKAMQYGYNGAAIVLSGLMFGSATGAAEALAQGQTPVKAFLIGFWNVIKVLGTGFILAFILGMIIK